MLRRVEVEDVSPEWVTALADADVVRWTEARHREWDENAVKRYVIDSNAAGVSELIGLFLRSDGTHIGNVRLSGFSETHRRVDLGIMLFRKDQWGKGYGREALDGVCRYAFDDLGLHKVCADYYAANEASARMFAGAGFAVEGVLREHFRVGKGWCDSVKVARLESGASDAVAEEDQS